MSKNEALKDIKLFNYLTNDKVFTENWTTKKVSNPRIQKILNTSSKRKTGNRGEPDLIYINEAKQLLILIENKDSITEHKTNNKSNAEKYAVDGVIHYLNSFKKENINKLNIHNFFDNWKIIGIAFSGDIEDEYNHLISTFILDDDKVIDINTEELLDEYDYISFFENIDLEKISKNISKSSSEINRILRAIDSQKRPILLSALMICLYENDSFKNDFKLSYKNWGTTTIIRNIPTTISDILKDENIDSDKIQVLVNELSFIRTDNDLTKTDILKEILEELETNVIPLFNKRTNYDIIGKFYEEFLRFAGVTNVKKGIVLTPNHITKLFTELIDIKVNDVILDTCCGTGAFLIAGMNSLIDTIENSSIRDKKNRIKNLKEKQLIGFEKSSTMYSLAISNMLFRGDGKSRIYNHDSFSEDSKKALDSIRETGINPSIGFINPPFGGRDNKANPTKKEIQFLEYLLDNVSRYGVIIAPLSTYFKDEKNRNRILTKHKLKYVINMPSELFQPNASTHTAIAVFETNIPHDNSDVIFYNLNNDGFILSKNKGRTDPLNRWIPIKKNLFNKIQKVDKNEDKINLLKQRISFNDEWVLQAHSKTDFSNLSEKSFSKTLREFIIFSLKYKLNLVNKEIDEITFMEILLENEIKNDKVINKNIKLDTQNWKEFLIDDIFRIDKGQRLEEINRIEGTTPLVTAGAYNQGINNYINYDIFKDKMDLNHNKLTVDMFCNVFYHEYEYFSDDNIHTLFFKNEKNSKYYNNRYVNLFLATILKQLIHKYDFGRQVRLKRLPFDTIKLPVINDKPDFEFMEDFIKSLPYSKSL